MTDGYAVGDGEEARESERPALQQLAAMGYAYASPNEINAERESTREVLLRRRLAGAIERLNPDLSRDEVGEAIRQLEEVRHGDTLVETNEKIHARLVGLSRSGGLTPVTIVREGKGGPSYLRVRVIDFDDIGNNDFLATNQFVVSGHRDRIVPDIVLFVNGVPLAVIECKSPTPSSQSPIEDAYIKNLSRYQRANTGHERLFHYNHVLAAVCGYDARAGTVGSGFDKYAPWPGEYPSTMRELATLNGRSRKQEILLGTLLSREVLLDTLQNFVLYDSARGKRAKLLARQPQYGAVTKSIQRIGAGPGGRGGVIWHTQGSGKSLSMLWLALLARRKFQNPPIVVVTDRRQLDRQILSVFKRHGYNVHQARSIRDLARLLRSPRAKTVLAVIDKFSGAGACTGERAICLVDEAHRSQFGIKAAEMRKAIPNGIFFAFTGTPLDKKEKSTYRVFGPLLDKYGFRESQADGATLPIMYDGRLARLSVNDEAEDIDRMFERVFGDLDPDTRRRIRQKYANRTAIMESSHRIARIAEDVVEHYGRHVRPNGFKAMLVTSSKTAAVRYKEALDSIAGSPESKIIMSETDEGHIDAAEHARHSMTQEQRESAAERFKREDDPTEILIVVDMLLVGYDVPICQAMYLDKGLREHGLLQAIARVNRPYGDAKAYGLVVDYYGVTRELHKALEAFDRDDVSGAVFPLAKVFEGLRLAHAEAMAHFSGVDMVNYDETLGHFADGRKREEFRSAFRKFERLLNMALPDARALEYVEDLRRMAKILCLFAVYYDAPRPPIREYGPKVRELVDSYIMSSDMAHLVKNAPIEHGKFLDAIVSGFASGPTRAALLIARIRIIIDDIGSTDPVYAMSLRERLEGIIRRERERRIGPFDELSGLYRECVDRDSQIRIVFGGYDATPLEFSLYHTLEGKLGREAGVRLAKDLFRRVNDQRQIIDWREKVTVKKLMQREIHEALGREGLGEGAAGPLRERILQVVRAHPDDAP